MNDLYVQKIGTLFSYKFSVLKTCIDYLKMHSECTILMQISQNFPGENPPDPHLREGVTPSLPLSALRASVKPSASLVTCAPPAVEVLDPPLTVYYRNIFIFFSWHACESVSIHSALNEKIMKTIL